MEKYLIKNVFVHKTLESTTMSPILDENQITIKQEPLDEDELIGIAKKQKMNSEENVVKKINPVETKKPEVKTIRCPTCKQYDDTIQWYSGHPPNAVEEYVALIDDRLKLFNGDEDISVYDERPLNKITWFSVYDKNSHLCLFDTGLIENNAYLYLSGYVKPIYDENPSTDEGIPTYDIGPINEWYISGYDGGEKALLAFSTAYGEYYLMEPSDEYKPLMQHVSVKIQLCKFVIEYLMKHDTDDPKYEDLLQHLQDNSFKCNEFTEENLLKHAHFICNQVHCLDLGGWDDPDAAPLMELPCMRALMKLSGVVFGKKQQLRRLLSNVAKKEKKKWTPATTTNLVKDVFEAIFGAQIKNNENKQGQGPKRKRCGHCEVCQRPDCGKCSYCKDMLKFGGTGRSKQACALRKCANMAIDDNIESDNEIENEVEDLDKPKATTLVEVCREIVHKVQWVGAPFVVQNSRKCYEVAKVGDEIIKADDFVMLNSIKPNKPLTIAKVIFMYEDCFGNPMFHANLFCRGTDTILGETSDPREVYVVNECDKLPLGSIVHKADVEYKKQPSDWAMRGGIDFLPPQLEDDGKTFFYQMRYDSEHARFEYFEENKDEEMESMQSILGITKMKSCDACRNRKKQERFETPDEISDGIVNWRGEVYKKSVGVYLTNDAFEFVDLEVVVKEEPKNEDEIDHELYPEYYRKLSENLWIKGSYDDTPKPFCIGLIQEVSKNASGEIHVTVLKFYRPENTFLGANQTKHYDINKLYCSSETVTVPFSKVMGRCYIAYEENLSVAVKEWSQEGPDRFYFSECYDVETSSFTEPSREARHIGPYKGKGQNVKSKKNKSVNPETEGPAEYPKARPLKTMDIFAGCGGLTEGLHQSGIAETMWAIEMEKPAANAYRRNHPNTTVYTEDSNDFLRRVMEGDNSLPQRGDVELLCGGPPCQGFSGMNRFNAGQYSAFKNSLIATYLSFCDYYRPKYFILENVRNFVSFKRSMVLKLTMRSLLAMGYQVTMGVLQAGHYGIPQTRRRLIILASAPGTVLPSFPEPQHVFCRRACQLQVIVNEEKFTSGIRYTNSAPYRPITVWDAMSDLPEIKSGSSLYEMEYKEVPKSYFQRIMRGDNDILTDHVCKSMAPIVDARMSLVPLAPGSDWRALPNISVRLSDGTYSSVLKYTHRLRRQNPEEPPRGVCSCAEGKPCDPTDKPSSNTLTIIPWCLPHTADRHNHWSGLYGRLDWNGFFSTTVTNPEPMGKQGRVLHPFQHRVVSVRECARSQGFPDRYQFSGNILDRHRQIGNAVPPPMGKALGREILKAVSKSSTDYVPTAS